MKNIAIVRQTFNPFGGAERFISSLLQSINGTGEFNFSLIGRKWHPIEGINFIKIDPFYVGSLMREWGFAKACQRFWTSQKFDEIQSHERIPGCSIFRAGDGVHKRYLQLREMDNDSKLALSTPFHRYVCRVEEELFLSDRLKYVICNSRMVKNDILVFFPKTRAQLKVIYNGVDTVKFSPQLQKKFRNQTREKLDLTKNAKVLIYVGSGFKRKGLKLILELLPKTPRDLNLLIVGGDKHIAKYQALSKTLGINSRVRFLGACDPLPFYGASDGFVLPTLYDPFPNAAMEAFASGLPVITTYTSGASEFIKEGYNGYSVDYFNPDSLLSAVDELYVKLRNSYNFIDTCSKTVSGLGIQEQSRRILSLYQD